MAKTTAKRQSFSFTLILSGFDQLSDEVEGALYGGGCDDAILGIRNGIPYLEFDREAQSLPEAIMSAIADVQHSGVAHVVSVDPGDLVTASQIARRVHRTRQSIQQLIAKKRGPGSFPAPIGGLTARSPRWSWAEVAQWMRADLHDTAVSAEDVQNARFVFVLNQALAWPDWVSLRTATHMRRCIQPDHVHTSACQTRDWRKDLQKA